MSGDEMVVYGGTCPDCGAVVKMSMPVWLGAPAKSFRCESCADKLLAGRSAAVQRESPAEFRARRMRECGIPEMGRWQRELAHGFGAARDWVWERRYRGSLFLATVESGAGKSWACQDVAVDLAVEGEEVVWIECSAWFRETCALLAQDAGEAERRIRQARGAALLVLNDVGKQQQTQRASEILWELLDWRVRLERRRTWMTSNLSGEELAAFLGRRYETVRGRLLDGFEAWTGGGE